LAQTVRKVPKAKHKEQLVLSGHVTVREETDDNSVEFRTGCAMIGASFFLGTNQREKHLFSKELTSYMAHRVSIHLRYYAYQ
jgi:hypothetical protein